MRLYNKTFQNVRKFQRMQAMANVSAENCFDGTEDHASGVLASNPRRLRDT